MKKVLMIAVCLLVIASVGVLAQQHEGKMNMQMCKKMNKGMDMQGCKGGMENCKMGMNCKGCKGCGNNGMMMAMPFMNIMTDAQKAEMKKMHIDHQKEMIALGAELKTIKLDIMSIMDSENIDEKTLNSKIDQASAVTAKIEKAQVGMMIKMKKMLTPEQVKKIKEMKNEHMNKTKKEMKKEDNK